MEYRLLGPLEVIHAGQTLDLGPLRQRLRGLLMLALYRSGRQAEALGTFEDLPHALRQVGEEMTIGLVLDNLASLAAVRGEHHQAADLARESLVHYRTVPYREGFTSALDALAAACTALGSSPIAEPA